MGNKQQNSYVIACASDKRILNQSPFRERRADLSDVRSMIIAFSKKVMCLHQLVGWLTRLGCWKVVNFGE